MALSTNPPHFNVVTCRDNGEGWTLDEFVELMEGGVGDSTKRVKNGLTARRKRPMIGRIGIGLLGVAQICHEFEIRSHHRRSKSAFRATVTIHDYLEQAIDGASADEAYPIGIYTSERIPYEADKAGTVIVVNDVKRGFTIKYRGREQNRPPRDFKQFLTECHQERTVATLGDYWELLWGLAVQCPLPYHDGGPIVSGRMSQEAARLIEELRARVEDYDFRVIVDQVRLFNPVLLPNRERGRSLLPHRVHRFVLDEDSVYGQPLRVKGYLVAQRRRVMPSELRGVLVRIRGVGVGGYDKSFLDYALRAEGPRSVQVSGELFVEHGLEDALNIDRASFNEMHPHYLRLQKELHEQLRVVFDDLIKTSAKRSEKAAALKRKETREKLLERIESVSGVKYEISDAPSSQELPVAVDAESGRILVKEDAQWPASAKKAEMAKNIAIAAAVAEMEEAEDEGKRGNLLLELLQEVL